MAGLLGEGGLTVLSGSWSSTTPATLADFRTVGIIDKGVDGRPCNIYCVTNGDTSSTYYVAVRVGGLQENSTTSAMFCLPNVPKYAQNNEHANNIYLVQGWLTDTSGANLTGAGTTGSCIVTGEVISRRE